jgi:nicotinamidase-related amidase
MPRRARRQALLWLAAAVPAGLWAQTPPVAPPRAGRSALLVVDAQVGVLATVWESARVVAQLEKLVAKARAAGVPVLWVQHADDELKHGSAAWQLMPNFVPTAAEPIIHKRHNSSFALTDLDQRLRALGVTRVVLAGAASNWCIRSTAYAALERGYDLALVSDAHSTEALRLPDGKTVPAEVIVAELNAVLEWVSAPNVRTEVKTTDALKF